MQSHKAAAMRALPIAATLWRLSQTFPSFIITFSGAIQA